MQRVKLEYLARAKLEYLRRVAWNDFFVFARDVCGKNLLEEVPHREVCEFLVAGLENRPSIVGEFKPTYKVIKDTKKSNKKLLMLPRNTFKSTIASQCLPLWLLWRNPNLRIMLDCETLGNAKLYLSAIKDMMVNNEMLRMVCTDEHGQYLLEPNDKIAGGFTEESVILKHRSKLGMKEPSIFCSGVDNARTGMHPDVIIMDDLVSEKNVTTEGLMKKVKEHYQFSLSLLEIDGVQVVIGTRYHMADLYSELLQSDAFDKMVRPAIGDNGDLFFPSRLSHEYLDKMRKEQGSRIFNSQYMLNPIDSSNAVFTRDMIQYYDIKDNFKYPEFKEKYILVDLAISKSKRADWTVILPVGITKDNKVWVLDYDRGRYHPKEALNALFSMYKKHPDTRYVGIETVLYQKSFKYLVEDEMRRTGTYMRLRDLKPDKDKERRISALEPLFQNGDVLISKHHRDLERELLEFPFSKHDDIVDALAYIIQIRKPGNSTSRRHESVYRPVNEITHY